MLTTVLLGAVLAANLAVLALLLGHRRHETVRGAIREEVGRLREDLAHWNTAVREEVGAGFRIIHDGVRDLLADAAARQRERLDDGFLRTAQQLEAHFRLLQERADEAAARQETALAAYGRALESLTALNDQRLEAVREAVERQLATLNDQTRAQLSEIRATVDHRLQETLEQRLGESFRLVSQRLEEVHRGLGEMQALAAGVGDLKRVLANVKTRGVFGEMQLAAALAQMLSPEQYRLGVEVRPGSGERVDAAVVLPGDREGPVWLPIDAKFPLDVYERLIAAEERLDAAQVAAAGRELEARLKQEAKSIHDKYIAPPATTDFALLFLPVEGLYAEALRRNGLLDTLQRDYRVVITGPTTLTALLSSLQMGFRTLAIQRRSSEVWALLGAIRTEFGRFGEALERTQKKLREASTAIDAAAVRSRAIQQRLNQVEALPTEQHDAAVGEAPRLAE